MIENMLLYVVIILLSINCILIFINKNGTSDNPNDAKPVDISKNVNKNTYSKNSSHYLKYALKVNNYKIFMNIHKHEI